MHTEIPEEKVPRRGTEVKEERKTNLAENRMGRLMGTGKMSGRIFKFAS